MFVLYLSSYLGTPVFDARGRPLGRLADMAARLGPDYPPVTALRVRKKKREHLYVDWEKVRTFEATQVILGAEASALPQRTLEEEETLLARNVLDRQIIDLEGRRVVRVQDIQLARVRGALRVVGVDVSASALLRRLGLRRIADWMARNHPPEAVDWKDVDLASWREPAVKLKVSRRKLQRLRPADLAEIAATLPTERSAEMLAALSEPVAAQALEEMTPEAQARVVRALDPQKASLIIGKMDPDDAADLLQELEAEEQSTLLELMEPEEAARIRSLLVHPVTSAGGLMNPEFITVRPNTTASEALRRIRRLRPEPEQTYAIFVTDREGRLLGVTTLLDLVLADPGEEVSSFMQKDPIVVATTERRPEVLKRMLKYDLLALPVVDKEGRLVGTVTVDDVLEVAVPRGWRRDKRLFHRE